MPVISVGNLTWGGNGKTPMVEFIALWLADSGISPLILSRVSSLSFSPVHLVVGCITCMCVIALHYSIM